MASTLTMAIVTQKDDDDPKVEHQLSGTFCDGYRCQNCSALFTEETAQAGSIWQCEECDSYGEYEEDYEPTKGECCNGYYMSRADGDVNDSARGVVCNSCSDGDAFLEEFNVFVCDDDNDCCDHSPIDPDDAEEHLCDNLHLDR